MATRVFLTGGSGFVGAAVIDELLSRDYGVNALVHSRPLDARNGQVQSILGDLFDATALDGALRDCQAIIHLVGIIEEKPLQGITFERIHHQGTRSVIAAAKRAGLRRFVQMSALGVRPGAVSAYHQSKYRAEQAVRESGLDWTIIRPSLIHGPDGDFMRMEARWARFRSPPFLFMPYFGRGLLGRGGAGQLQPVYVKDVARAFVDALEKPQTTGEVYLLGGPDAVSWPQLHRLVAKAVVGRRRWVMALPVWKAKLLTHIIPAPLLPFNRDQVIMSQEDNTCDLAKFTADFGWTPVPFESTLREYADKL